MNFRDKSWLRSIEVVTGSGLILVGVVTQVAGLHSVLTEALAPFGIGLILSEGLTFAAKAARERAKVRIRRDDE